MVGPEYHDRRHKVSDVVDHVPIPTAIENDIVTYDSNGLPAKASGVQIGSVIGGLIYQGTWDASTNTPTLADGTGTQGHFYRVVVAGSQDLGSGLITFSVEDWVVHNGSIWQKADHSQDAHNLGGSLHLQDTLANLNTKVSDATLIDESRVQEPAQAIGYYLSEDRGGEPDEDGSEFRSFDVANAAVAKGVANGDEVIIIHVDTRNTYTYTVNVPAGKKVTLKGSEPLESRVALVKAYVGDGGEIKADNLWIEIYEEAGISSGKVTLEQCYLEKIKDNPGTGYATNLDGIFINTLGETSAWTDIKNLNSAFGNFLDLKTGVQRMAMFQNMDMGGHEIFNAADPTAPQSLVTKAWLERGPIAIEDSEEAVDSTTSTTPQLAVRFTKTLETAKYAVFWQMELQGAGTVITSCKGEFEINGTPYGDADQAQPAYCNRSGFFILNATAGSYNFDFNFFRAGGGAGTVYCRKKRLLIVKVVA